MIVKHMTKAVLAPNITKYQPWEDLITDLRRIFSLTGNQEIIAIQADEQGITLKIKDHGSNSQSSKAVSETI